MDNEIRAWLYDIQKAIAEIDSFFSGRPKVFADYQNDLRTKRAVERDLEIVGEAMSSILKRDPAIQVANARKLVDARNRISHGYDAVSDDVIWGIVVRHLPILRAKVELLLSSSAPLLPPQ